MSVCGQNGQAEEDSGSEEVTAATTTVRDLYKQKPVSKAVRVLTVLAYLLSVSLAAILLSVYYVCVWKSPELPPLNDTVPAASKLSARPPSPAAYTGVSHNDNNEYAVRIRRYQASDTGGVTWLGGRRAAHPENWGISISVSQLGGCGGWCGRQRAHCRCRLAVVWCAVLCGAFECDVGQVVRVGQRALVRGLLATGHRNGRALLLGPRGGAGRAVRAQARQEDGPRAHRHRVRVLRVAGRHHALALLRLLLGAQGRAIRAAQGVAQCREANRHHTNAHMLYAPHRRRR